MMMRMLTITASQLQYESRLSPPDLLAETIPSPTGRDARKAHPRLGESS